MADKIFGCYGNGDVMETYLGKYVNPLKIKPEDIDIRDIAKALSQKCRFNGMCSTLYSIAEHSIRVMWLVDMKDKLGALLHDANEAYLPDVPRPVKMQPEFLSYWKPIEAAVQDVINEKFGVNGVDWDAIKKADNILLATEGRDLMHSIEGWYLPLDPLPSHINPIPSLSAEAIFLSMFSQLHHDH